MTKFKVGDKVKCIEDDSGAIELGTTLTIKSYHDSFNLYSFEETTDELYPHELEPNIRTIRDVKIGDIVISPREEAKVLAVGEHGFATTEWDDLSDNDGYWYMWEHAEKYGWKIKQEVREMTVAEIEELIGTKIKIIKEKI